MPLPFLAFCPYLPMDEPIEFGDWKLGPLAEFEERWADPKFKKQAKAFLEKFVDGSGEQIERPSLLCRHQGLIDGTSPSTQEEIEALTAAIAFAFLDTNPRRRTSLPGQPSWCVVTTDNTEPFFWPIDLASGDVIVTTGIMVKTSNYQMNAEHRTIRPPLDLHMPTVIRAVDAKCLEAVYQTVLKSLQTPETEAKADRLRIAIGWFAKAWRNTETVTYEDRVVFLKTAFEALSGTSNSRCTARFLRQLFEAIPHTTTPLDSKRLVWSPEERAVHTLTINGKSYQITDLEQWFMAFADARNKIIHKGKSPPLEYSGRNAAYDGHFVFTAEFLLRAAIKVSLSSHDYPDLWRSDLRNTIAAASSASSDPEPME